MSNKENFNLFTDIMGPRRSEFSNFLWVSRKLNVTTAFKQMYKVIPAAHKQKVLSSEFIQNLIQQISDQTGVSKVELERTVKLILDEIGFSKQLRLLRWLGLVLAKICQKVYTGIHVNEASVARLKSAMGGCPVIFAPSHRSYADFILMSYILFNYDIAIPSIASGMDFHAMWGMGNMLRNTGAFFMRRSYNEDNLYWATFRQYVHQLVTGGDLPIEFFIEGTRSRSCKTLTPKYGLLSMLLKPLFTGEVPDILVVPINISYDRVLEEKLFAFELLGVPKPKESTSGFFKSLSIIKEKYGNIYVDFATPISLKQYFGDQLDRAKHALRPLHLQTLDSQEKQLISKLAYHIVHTQQKHATLTVFNLAALVLNHNLVLGNASVPKNELSQEIIWLSTVLESLGARMKPYSAEALESALAVHSNLVHVDENLRVRLTHPPIDLNEANRQKTKGYQLGSETMTAAVPVFMVQLYANPCLHYLIDCSLVIMVANAYNNLRTLEKNILFGHFQFLRSVFSYEFVFYDQREHMEFEDALAKLQQLQVIELTANNNVILGSNAKLKTFLTGLLNPFIAAYCCIYYVLQEVPASTPVEHNYVLVEAQRKLERMLRPGASLIHPYCLSLDTLGMCLQQLASLDALQKYTEDNISKYRVNRDKLTAISNRFDKLSLKCVSKTLPTQITAKL